MRGSSCCTQLLLLLDQLVFPAFGLENFHPLCQPRTTHSNFEFKIGFNQFASRAHCLSNAYQACEISRLVEQFIMKAVAVSHTRNKWLKRSVAVHHPLCDAKTAILGNVYLIDDEVIGFLLSALKEGFSLAATYQRIARSQTNGSDRSMLGRLRHTGS